MIENIFTILFGLAIGTDSLIKLIKDTHKTNGSRLLNWILMFICYGGVVFYIMIIT